MTLTPADRIALGWGKLRRACLIAFNPERVRRNLARRVGQCDRSGACCRLMVECPSFDGSDGPKCSIYRDRGPTCSVFPIDERDLRDRDRIMPGHPCGYRFIPEAEFARRDAASLPRAVFPWEADGDAMGGRVRRTTMPALVLALARTAWKVLSGNGGWAAAVSRLMPVIGDGGRLTSTAVTADGAPVLFLRAPETEQAARVQFVRVVSGSMEPRIPQGALVMVEPARGTDLRPGTVACFRSGGELMVHHVVARVKGASGDLFVHAGESGAVGLLDPDDVVGRVAGIVPEEGGALRPVAPGKTWSRTTLPALRFGGWLHRFGVPSTWVWTAARRVRVRRGKPWTRRRVAAALRKARRLQRERRTG